MYQFSTDYEELFRLLCEGYSVVGFVDYELSKEFPKYRDVCEIRRRRPFDISIGVRGVSYGSVYPYLEEEGHSEHDQFVGICKALHLEFIPAQAAPLDMTGQDIAKLMSFYGVSSIYSLVETQARQIERLQAQVPQLRNEFPPSPRA